MVRVLMLALIVCALDVCDVHAEAEARTQRQAASLTVSAITKKREYKVGEPWFDTFHTTAAAPKDYLTIRAWTRFFADYEAIPEDHGPLSDFKFSDVLATGGQIWRGGVPQTNRETILPDHGLVP